jgi:transposase
VAGETDLAAENARLCAVNARLRQCVQRQASELESLRAANTALRARNTELAVQVEGLRARVADQDGRIQALCAQVGELGRQLRRDSSNSSLPPSAEGLGKKPAVPRQRGARRPGKQPGAEGKHLAQVEDCDQTFLHVPTDCRKCGDRLDDAPVAGVVRRQVFDLPQIRLVVTEHQAQRRVCGCGAVTTATFPVEVTAPACYGDGVRAAVAYLQGWQHLPVDRAAQAVSDLLGVPIATGTVAGVMAQTGEAVAPAVAEIAAQVAAAQVVSFDETGARVAGRGHWVHTAATLSCRIITWMSGAARMGWTLPGSCRASRGSRCMIASRPTIITGLLMRCATRICCGIWPRWPRWGLSRTGRDSWAGRCVRRGSGSNRPTPPVVTGWMTGS